jgi:hypothetical protein
MFEMRFFAQMALAMAAMLGGMLAHAQAPPSSGAESLFFPKGTNLTSLVSITEGNLGSSAQQTLIVTLQGLVARQSPEQIYVDGGSRWRDFLRDRYGVPVISETNPWALVSRFGRFASGYVLYDYAANADSVNAATSLAGALNAVAVDASIEANLIAAGITNRLADVRTRNEAWVWTNYPGLLSTRTVVEQQESKTYHLRDYAVMAKAFTFHDGLSTFRTAVMSAMGVDAAALGWNGDEANSVSDSSLRGVFTVASDWCLNLSTLSSVRDRAVFQRTYAPVVTESNVHYVTFVVTDGDNLAFNLGDMGNYLNNSYRGRFNMGYGLSPSLADLAPAALRWYYEGASNGPARDFFVAGPSGSGYLYPSKYPAAELDEHVRKLNDFMGRADLNIVQILDFNSFNRTDLWDKFTAQPNIDALFYLEYAPYNGAHGAVIFSNGKPVIGAREMLWSGLEDEPALLSHLNSAPRTPSSANGYSLVVVHAWSKTMSNICNVVTNLASDVRVVTPDAFVKLMRQNVAGGGAALAASSAPRLLGAEPVATNRMEVFWRPVSGKETGFVVERRAPWATNWTQLATLASNVTMFADTNLSAGSSWLYRVRSQTTTGFSDYSVQRSATAPITLVPLGATWKFLDTGADLGAAWRSNSFNDTFWRSGPAQLGFGDGDEQTVVANHLQFTTYFRYRFVLPAAGSVRALRGRLLRDDGAVVYLNGVEIFRSNMPTGAVNYLTPASSAVSGSDETNYFSFAASGATLCAGTNLVAVEIHQSATNSSDISFNLELTALGNAPPMVSITNAPGTSVADGARSLTVGASAGDDDGSVRSVELLADGRSLGVLSTPPFALAWTNASMGAHTLTALATDDQGFTTTSEPVPIQVALSTPVSFISPGAVWHYFDRTNDLGTAWRSNNFIEGFWGSGPARLGFGGDGEVTQVASNRQWTTYFRRTFYVPSRTGLQALNARLTRDDGAVVYLNGAEIWRDPNLPSGVITNQTPALSALGGTNETNWLTLSFPASTLDLLTPGSNLLAVEVHQSSLTSSDLGFDLELTGTAAILSQPALNLSLSGSSPRLSWPAEAGYFNLYSATNLHPPVTWTIATNPAVLSNNQWRLTLPVGTNGSQFYRMQMP